MNVLRRFFTGFWPRSNRASAARNVLSPREPAPRLQDLNPPRISPQKMGEAALKAQARAQIETARSQLN